ncbi:MAG TPA: branched-chain amino acid ABC transporter permease, partial [Trueperaceae bacterium]|nr:branched-chain amino acid ABC transporter permease [Trueperaceae bacterium]
GRARARGRTRGGVRGEGGRHAAVVPLAVAHGNARAMIGNALGVLFDGVAYGSLLFVISIGLSVTMGLMNFVNLAHGAFAMLGGYACVMLMTKAGVPFLATLPVAFAVAAVAGIVLERTLYVRLYKATPLDQVMFTIGLVFMAIAATTYFFGPSQQPVHLPDFLRGQVQVAGIGLGAYRMFLIAVVAVITLVLHLLLVKTRFGAQVRASVDNAVASAGLGINVNRVFGVTFALGSGLAGLGGALGICCVKRCNRWHPACKLPGFMAPWPSRPTRRRATSTSCSSASTLSSPSITSSSSRCGLSSRAIYTSAWLLPSSPCTWLLGASPPRRSS